MRRVLLVLASLALVPAFAADIYRCQAGGAVTYQQRPCDEGTAGGPTAIPAEFPPVNTAERERLLAREAALDQRLEMQRERLAREAATRQEREIERTRLAAAEAAAAAEPRWLVVSPPVRMRAGSGNPRSRPRP